MNAGELRHMITIQTPTHGRSPGGSAVTTWQTLAIVHAAIRPASERESMLAGSLQSQASHTITIRYRPHVRPKCRVLFGERTFEVGGVVNVDERNTELRLVCSENGGGA